MNADVVTVLPEAALAGGVVGILAIDLLSPANRRGITGMGVAACLLSLWFSLGSSAATVGDMLRVDGVTMLARPAIAILTALLLVAGHGERKLEDRGAWAASIVGLGVGAMLTAASANVVLLWIGIEMMSLAGYVLAAWRGGDRGAAEAGMKYMLFGSFASGLMLFGVSHLYGLTGRLDFVGIGVAMADAMPVPALAALCLAAVGLAYKLALVPFHFYAPDVYQGAPALSVASVAVLPKVAAIAALVRALGDVVPAAALAPSTLSLVLAVVASLTLLFAAFTALAQRDAKRIVAFSAIGHAGAVLLAVACAPGRDAVAAAAFYLAGYAAANVGALVCLGVIERERGSCALDSMAGAVRRWPWLTAALCVFLFSLAGLPPLAGFLGKWGVLRQALHLGLEDANRAHLAWAALALLLSSVIAAWSYLLIVRAAVLLPAPFPALLLSKGEDAAGPRVPWSIGLVIAVCAVATVGLGLWLDGFESIGRVLD